MVGGSEPSGKRCRACARSVRIANAVYHKRGRKRAASDAAFVRTRTDCPGNRGRRRGRL